VNSIVLTDRWGNTLTDHELARRGVPGARPRPREGFAEPTVGSVRSIWTEGVVAGLTPDLLAQVLRSAAHGYPDRFFVLAEEMEERDLHYRAVLGTRKTAITGIEPIVVPGGEDALSVKIADAVKEIVEQPAFVDDYATDNLDGLSKGYALVETIWDRSRKEWWPDKYEWRDPRHFLLDRRDGRTLRMKSELRADGVELPPFVFSIHRPKLKSGLPVRGGLARLAAWAFLFKHYSLKNWMKFLEVFGMPLRVGRFGPGAKDDDKRVLLRAVRDLSTDAAAIIPKGMEIDFHEVSGGSGNGLFGNMAEYLDKQISKGVLGQTMSTDDGSSLAQAQVHEDVRHDIARADARQLAVTANRDLIRPFVDFNFGPQERYPTVVWPVVEAEDIKALAEVVDKMVGLGMEVSADKMRERMGFEDPDEDDELLVAPVKTLPAPAGEEDAPPAPPKRKPPAKSEKARRLGPACPHCGGHHELAAAGAGQSELDLMVEEALSHWEADIDPIFDPIRQLASQAKSYEEFAAGLDRLRLEPGSAALVARMAVLAMKARGNGDIGEDPAA
jgi:phage gp29-like protein